LTSSQTANPTDPAGSANASQTRPETLEGLHAGDLRIDSQLDTTVTPPALRLLWTGRSSDRHPASVLDPYFVKAVAAAVARSAAIELHFEKLDHFNSSTITSVIQMIQDALERKVRITIFYDHQLKWQKLSFDVLRVFAKGDDVFQIKAV